MKENFLQIYGTTHLKVLQPDLIQTVFRKTGIVPFNQDVVTPDMMAPSCDTSYKVFTPIFPSMPIRIVTDLLVDVIQPPVNPSEDKASVDNIGHTFPVRAAFHELRTSSAWFLTSDSPIKSSSEPPDIPALEISPMKPWTERIDGQLLTMMMKTPMERKLQEVLLAKHSEAEILKSRVLQLQSGMILQQIYCGQVRRQLAAREKKVDKKGKKGGRLAREGIPRMLTDDEFYERVCAQLAAMEEAEKEKENRGKKKEDLMAELEEWAKEEKNATKGCRRSGRKQLRNGSHRKLRRRALG